MMKTFLDQSVQNTEKKAPDRRRIVKH